MSLPLREARLSCKDAEVDETKVRELEGKELGQLVLLRENDFKRSLAGGLLSVCMTRSFPAYDGR
eukprot:6177311-Pleurochrysis_carterae.AAC.1